MLGDRQPEEHPAPLGHVGDAELGAGGGRALAMSAPSTRIVPAIGRTSPEIARSVVVLPAPFGPSSATTSPALDVEVERRGRPPPRPARRQPFELSTGPPPSANVSVSFAAEPEVGGDHLGVGAHVARRADRDHLAELEHDDAIADPEHEPHVVIDQQDRRAAIHDLAQVSAEPDRLPGVEPGGRLVEAQQLGPCRQRGRRRRACADPG